MFRNRIQAAEELISILQKEKFHQPLVLGIPRGAVPMAARVAGALRADLDVILVRRITLPQAPETAVGAVTEDGTILLSSVAGRLGLSATDLAGVAQVELEKIAERRLRYTPGRDPIDVAGRDVILVDDGIATGVTMRAAVHDVKRRGAARVIVAAPVAAPIAAQDLISEDVESRILWIPTRFFAVSLHYHSFPEVSDDEVIRILDRSLDQQVSDDQQRHGGQKDQAQK